MQYVNHVEPGLAINNPYGIVAIWIVYCIHNLHVLPLIYRDFYTI